MSSNVNGDRQSSGSGANAETSNEMQNESLPLNAPRNESTSSGVAPEPDNEASASGTSNRNEIPSNFFQFNSEELPNVLQARNLLGAMSSRTLSGVTRVLQRSGSLFSPSVSSAVAVAALEASSSFSPSNSSLTQNSSEQRSPERMAEQEALLRRITERIARDRRERRSEERAERIRERRERRRRRRSRDSSSENEESSSRRQRRAENVVESLGELMVVPTSSTLGENAEGETSRRSDANADGSTGNANSTNANEDTNQNGDGPNSQEAESSNQPALQESTNHSSRGVRFTDNWARALGLESREEERNRMEASNRGSARGGLTLQRLVGREEGNEEGNDSDDDSINIDSVLDTELFGPLIDREHLLNNLMQRSIRRLRDVESEALAAQRSTDLKCPVCNEIFVDYEASNHPNAPGNRPGSTRCSHGALTLFTKLHQCPICFDEDIEPPNVVALSCGHVVCKEDFCKLGGHIGTERPAGCPKAKPLP